MAIGKGNQSQITLPKGDGLRKTIMEDIQENQHN